MSGREADQEQRSAIAAPRYGEALAGLPCDCILDPTTCQRLVELANRMEEAFRRAAPELERLAGALASIAVRAGPSNDSIPPQAELGAVGRERRSRRPTCPAYEELLCEIGVKPKEAELMSQFVRWKGPELAADLNATRRLGAVVRRMAKSPESRPIRARLAGEMALAATDSAEARRLLETSLKSAGAHLSVRDFEDLVYRAEKQEPEACFELVQVAREVAPFMPDPRGRPISVETATHALLLAALADYGHPQSFTHDAVSGAFVDRATRATRAAVNNSRFDPRRAVKIWDTDWDEFACQGRVKRRARRR
jgi:hypothetical protein